VFTQPLSFIGLPVVSVPVLGRGGLPLGVQVVAAPSGEAKALHVAGLLEEMGLTMEPPPADRWR
jgi:Asp-tRNA(Asn)/Glu-tRNA(Gln) amidotransferase A subunit family amidase